ncbi:hypothetical protein T439DRAFT_327229 [Meredithblackwellia eburnea MCA 4105]
MARFGLDSDEDDDDIQVDEQKHLEGGSDEGEMEADETFNDGEDSDEDNLPPPVSLMEEDEDTFSQERDEDEDEEGDEDEEEDDIPRRRIPSTVALSRRSMSYASPAPVDKPAEAWPQTVKLEPKRVALMQASFFQQGERDRATSVEQEPPQDKGKKRENPWIQPTSASAARSSFASAAQAQLPPPPAPISFPTSLPQHQQKPYRKYSRVPLTQSVTNGKEGNLVDFGLALGRSFKPGWGPRGELITLGKDGELLVRTVYVEDAEREKHLATLRLQLAATTISTVPSSASSDEIPIATTSADLRFSHFLPNSSTPHTPETDLWSLGSALFDEIPDLALSPSDAGGLTAFKHISHVRREARFSQWLATTVKAAVETDLSRLSSSETLFTLLSGNQLDRACDHALSNGDLRLATLLAQAGGDDQFREDVYLQLAKWREYRVDSHISKSYRKVYELLAGNVTIAEGFTRTDDPVDRVEDLFIAEGLDWKRALGLHLWFGTFQLPLADVVQRYEAAASSASGLRTTAPKPETYPDPSEEAIDPLFALIKIFTDDTFPLEKALLPCNFEQGRKGEWRLPWVLYRVLAKGVRRREFEEDGEGEEKSRGQAVTESYASQLERMGGKVWVWSIFVLLHLVDVEARAKSIKDVLSRNVRSINDEAFAFLTETLLVPSTWIYSAQAAAYHASHLHYRAFDYHLRAREWNAAHKIFVDDLAPEAIIRDDLGLLKRLLGRFKERQVGDWDKGGQIFASYAQTLDNLLSGSSKSIPVSLVQSLPILADRSPALKLRVAVSEMQSRLTVLSSRLGGQHASAIRPSALQEADRLVWLQSANSDFLNSSLQNASKM